MAAMTMPPDPMAGNSEGWVALHEMYKGARQGGFGMLEAALLIASIFTIHGLKPPEA
jgi:hypothetical protein